MTAALLAGEFAEAPERFFPVFAEFRSIAPETSAAEIQRYHEHLAEGFEESCRDLQYYLRSANIELATITDVRIDTMKEAEERADVLVSFSASGQRYGFLLDECTEINGRWYALDIDWLGQDPE